MVRRQIHSCSCANVLSDNMEQLHGLIGCWKAAGFVDPSDYHAPILRQSNSSSSVSGVLKRNELIRLVTTIDNQVLYGVYVDDPSTDFWVVAQKKPRGVVIKAKGELKYRGSYKLTGRTSKDIYWTSLRHETCESLHAIRWIRHFENTKREVSSIEVPSIPKAVIQRENGGVARHCVCGDSHEVFDGGSSSNKRSLFVRIRKPKVDTLTADLESPDKRKKTRGVWLDARLNAHWKPVQKWMLASTVEKTADVHVSHMHQFAMEGWLSDSSRCAFKKFYIETMVLEQAVDAKEIARHYHPVDQPGGDRVYMPKLNVVPASPRRVTRGKKKLRSCATEGCVVRKKAKKGRSAAVLDKVGPSTPDARGQALLGRRLSSGEDIKKLPGTQLVAKLRHELEQCWQQIEEKNERIEKLVAEAKRRQTQRKRQFFTEQFHCSGALKNQTLTNYFGLTNGWNDFVVWVTSFHVDFGDNGLVESHSDDVRSNELTPFENCLVAKAYVHRCPALLIFCALLMLPLVRSIIS